MQLIDIFSDTYPKLPLFLNVDGQPVEKSYFILYAKQLTPEILEEILGASSYSLIFQQFWYYEEHIVVLLQGFLDELVQQKAYSHHIDVANLNHIPSLDMAGLLVMDMDSTAIQIECIDELAKLAGCGDQVSQITERAMKGELDFEQSLRQRVATLAGQSVSLLEQVKTALPLMSGLEKMVHVLHQNGWKIAIASGGFTYFADYLKDSLGLISAVSNQLAIENGVLTGEVIGDVVDAQYKATTLMQLCTQYQIVRENSIAIGDGANDLLMMQAAGLGVAFHAKPKVQQQATHRINYSDLTALLVLLDAKKRFQQFNFE